MKNKRQQELSFNIHGLPQVDGMSELGAHSGIPPHRLWRLVFADRQEYTLFPIAKRTGGTRLISHPRPTLKRVQRWILRNILDHLRATSSSFGFERGSKLRFHGERHIGACAVLTLDIKDFFPSISLARVTRVFRIAGFSSAGAWVLARLCTREGTLPQGAPSSPKLANLVCFRMDRRLAGFAERRGFVYTRYADDLTFSAESMTALRKAWPFILHIVRDSGFKLNKRKARLVGARGAKIVTGLVLAENTVGVGRRRLRGLRAAIHRLHVGDDTQRLLTIQGWLDFVSDADPERYRNLVHYVVRLRAQTPDSQLHRLRIREATRRRANA